MKINTKKKWLVFVLIILLVGIGFCEKRQRDHQTKEHVYQEATSLVQEYVSEYLVQNYAGIDRIDWQGIDILWRDTPLFTRPTESNFVRSKAFIYISKDQYVEIVFELQKENKLADDLKGYIPWSAMNTTKIDETVEIAVRRVKKKLGQEEKQLFKNFQKNDGGSLNAKINYDLTVHALSDRDEQSDY